MNNQNGNDVVSGINNSNSNNVGVIPSVPIITPEMAKANISNNSLENNVQDNNGGQVDALSNFVSENVNSSTNSINVMQENNDVVDNISNESFINGNQSFDNQLSSSLSFATESEVSNSSDQLGLDSLYVSDSVQNDIVNNNLQLGESNEVVESNSINNDILQNNLNDVNVAVDSNTNINSNVNQSSDSILSDNLQNNVNSNYLNNNILNNQSAENDNEYLIKIFVGEKYEKIKNSGFSFPCFFCGISYLLYRKMYLYAFLTLLVCFTPLGFLTNIILAIFINKWYLKFAAKKIEKIKLSNLDKSEDAINDICSKKGGTSILAVFLGTFISFGFIILLSFLIMVPIVLGSINSAKDKLRDEILNNNGNSTDEFNGYYMYDFVNIEDIFEINVPSEFNDESSTNIFKYKYFSDSDSISEDCGVTLSAVMGYNSAKELSNQMATYYGVENILENTFNNIKWYNFVDNSSFETTYYYLTDQDGKVYLYNFSIGKDFNDVCESYHDSIIKSIKLK